MSRKRSTSRTTGSLIDAASSEPAKSNPKPDKNASYRIGQDRIDRINELSDEYRLQKASLVKFLLDYAFEAIDNGDLDLSPKLMKKRTLDI